MKRTKVKVIDPKACWCCKAQIATETHHRQPQSQNGGEEPENLLRVCHDCHNLYHTITNQRLANTVLARAQNFALWICQWPDIKTEMNGKMHGANPYLMAPEWANQEWADFKTPGVEVQDRSEGRLSRLGKITTYKVRDHLR